MGNADPTLNLNEMNDTTYLENIKTIKYYFIDPRK